MSTWFRRLLGGGPAAAADSKHAPAHTVDVRNATFRLDLPKHGVPRLTPTLVRDRDTHFVSAAVLAAKAKAFDDGLYAAVELAAQQGLGAMTGKAALLERTLERLEGNGPARAIVEAAAMLGGHRSDVSAAAAEQARLFLADTLRSKPLGFYTWSNQLASIFRQDRILQSDLSGAKDLTALAAILQADAAYARYLGLMERLTNRLACGDLRTGIPAGPVAVLPPSVAHETELIRRLYGSRPIPDGFDLSRELVAAIRAGRVDLKPTPSSGWYDYQTWALETLVTPERAVESDKLVLADRYREHLEELFRTILAATRETHVKQLEVRPAGAAFRPPTKVRVGPRFNVEPLPTHYRRRAEGYRFVRALLAERFGEDALGSMHRVRPGNMVDVDLGTELQHMVALFDAAAAAAMHDLGLPTDLDPAPLAAWALKDDPDLLEDRRMMVPVFFDTQRKKTKVWIIVGWSRSTLLTSFDKPPTVDFGANPAAEVEFTTSWFPLDSMVMAECYVTDLLDRAQFSAHCDRYSSTQEIIQALR